MVVKEAVGLILEWGVIPWSELYREVVYRP